MVTESCKIKAEKLLAELSARADTDGFNIDIDAQNFKDYGFDSSEEFSAFLKDKGFDVRDDSAVFTRKPDFVNMVADNFAKVDNDGTQVAGLDRLVKSFRRIDDVGLSDTTAPILSLAGSPHYAMRRAGELLGHLSLARTQDFNANTASQISVESKIKTFDKYQAYIFNQDAQGRVGIKKIAKEIRKMPQETQDIFDLVKTSYAEASGVEKISDRQAISSVIGEAFHKYGDGDTDSMREILAEILASGLEPVYFRGNKEAIAIGEKNARILADLFEAPANASYEMLKDLSLRYGQGDEALGTDIVKTKIRAIYDPAKVEANEGNFTFFVNNSLKSLREKSLEYKALSKAQKDAHLRDVGYVVNDGSGKFDYIKYANIYAKLSDDNIDKLATRFKDEILVRREASSLTSIETRQISIKDLPSNIDSVPFRVNDEADVLALYRITDMERLADATIRRLGVESELINTYGTADLDILKKGLTKAVRNEIDDTASGIESNAEKQKFIDKQRKRLKVDLAQFEDSIKYLYGDLQRAENHNSAIAVSERGVLALNNVRLMGGLFLGSIPESVKIAILVGAKPTAKEFLSAFARTNKAGRRASNADMRFMSVGLDLELATTLKARGSLDERIDVISGADRAINYGTEKFFLATGASWLNGTLKRLSGRIALNNMLDTIFKLADGEVVGKAEQVFLSKYGINLDGAKRIRAEIQRIKDTDGIDYDIDGFKVANMDYWQDSTWDIRNNLSAAVRQLTDDAILTPGLDRPLFFTRPGLRLLTQFKSFAMASFQKTTLLLAQKGVIGTNGERAEALAGAAGLLALGTGYAVLREMLKGKALDEIFEDDKAITNIALEGASRSGMFSYIGDGGVTALTYLTGGYINPAYHLDDDADRPQRFTTGRILKDGLGASAGLATDILQTGQETLASVFSDDEFTDADKRRALRLAPGQNLWFWRNFSDLFFDTNLTFTDN